METKILEKRSIAKLEKWTPLILLITSFTYFSILCVKSYSWVFVSSDSGNWLASAIGWIIPSQIGGNVYILLSHLISPFFSITALPAAMTILLTALPSSITVALTYLIIFKLTSRRSIAFICSLFLIGSAVFLIESTVTLYHALAITFLTAAYYSYLCNRCYLTTSLLALGAGTHIIILPIAIFWLLADRRLRYWFKPILLFSVITLLCYSFTLLLMYLPTPRFQSGGFNLASIDDYFTKTSSAIVGEISIFETPKRLLFTLELLLTFFGVALIPVYYSIRKPFTRPKLILFATTVFVLWYFVTCLDVMTWTYLAFLTPSIVILTAVGLSYLPRLHIYPVIAFATVFLILNPIFMNADVLTNQNPKGTVYFSQLQALPDKSIMLTDTGSLSLGLYYYITATKSHIMPLTYPYIDSPTIYPAQDYINYLKQTYYSDLNYQTTLTVVQSALDLHIPVYYGDYSTDDVLRRCVNLEPGPLYTVKRITSLTGLPPEAIVKEVK